MGNIQSAEKGVDKAADVAKAGIDATAAITKDAMEAADAAARRAADAADKAVKYASSTADKAVSEVSGIAKDLTKQFDATKGGVESQAAGIVKGVTGDAGDSKVAPVLTAVVAGVLVVGAAYYLYQEYKKKEGKKE
ncbi:hypothetical protein Rsub_01434 [Raphidocelis subcapitata]|uniref:Uncharacterized protein n=1 Tax=Raphidocelis subcapitata TaxID=307507 RepID=A0A2V0NVT8_9CHLO|nr:hypothetical protein Rsub_01434 [Raphidocelis subcapitata]|eukprot:GBF88935.1 hypothetical protein Rsub_01434 [Raphidocelis subcapitata]